MISEKRYNKQDSIKKLLRKVGSERRAQSPRSDKRGTHSRVGSAQVTGTRKPRLDSRVSVNI